MGRLEDLEARIKRLERQVFGEPEKHDNIDPCDLPDGPERDEWLRTICNIKEKD